MLKYLFSIAILLFIIPQPQLEAQVACVGNGCEKMPVAQQTELLSQFQYNYLDTLVDDISLATTSAAISGYAGVAEIDGAYHIGLSLPVGYKSRHDIWLMSPNVQTTVPVESAGISVLPRLELGYNPKEDKTKLGKKLQSLNRFEFYLSWFNYKYEKKSNLKFNANDAFSLNTSSLVGVATTGTITPDYAKAISLGSGYSLDWKHYGAGFRYRVIEKKSLTSGSGISWLGITVAVSLFQDHFYLYTFSDKQNTTIKNTNEDKLKWQYNNKTTLSSSVETIPVELKTGLGLSRFIRLNTSAGIAWTRGSHSLQAILAGPFTVDSTSLISQIATFSSQTTPATGIIAMNLYSNKRVNTFTPYFKPGLEFKLGPVRILFEGVMTKGAADTFILSIAADF